MMTDNQWEGVKKELDSPYSRVKLKIDGYVVTLDVYMSSETGYNIIVFVNGKFRSEWLLKDCEIRRRFCRKITKPAIKKKLLDLYDKRTKEYKELKNKKIIFYDPFWKSFKGIKSHFVRNNEFIELWTEKDDELYCDGKELEQEIVEKT